jgi:exosome complex component CSL4
MSWRLQNYPTIPPSHFQPRHTLTNFTPPSGIDAPTITAIHPTSTMTTQEPSIVIPGQHLGPISRYIPGPGTHIHNSNLYASILGFIHITTPPKPAGPQKRPTKITPTPPTPLPTLSIYRSPDDLPSALPPNPGAKTSQGPSEAKGDAPAQAQAGNGTQSQQAKSKTQVLPEVNSIVLCRVTRITTRQATVAILVVGDTVLEGEWQGLIRVQDVRATEKDRVKIFESFRPGDVVRAVVVSFSLSSPKESPFGFGKGLTNHGV